jgi:hypothetical protein
MNSFTDHRGPSAARRRTRAAALVSVACTATLSLSVGSALAAQPRVGLGNADPFAVLAGSTVTNSGPSVITGDVGVSPKTAVTGFPPGIVNGTIHAADATAGKAQTALTAAYNDAAGRTPAVSLAGGLLGGRTLTSGVYDSASALDLTGTLTLDAQGDPNSVFIFQAGSTLTTAAGSRVSLVNGAQACNVYWKVGSSATLGTTSTFNGNILALTSISVNSGVTVAGRALARNGAVTLINDRIAAAHCAAGTTGGSGSTGSGSGGSGSGGSGTHGVHRGTARLTTPRRSITRTVARYGTTRCVHGTFRVAVTGRLIRRVVFSLDGSRVATRFRSPFRALARPRAGKNHRVTAVVTFSDGTHQARRTMRFRSCAAAVTRLPSSPSAPPVSAHGFTG